MATDQELTLVLTGGASARLEDLRAAAGRAGVSSRVRHLGYVAGDVLPALYRRARAMVFPSLYEGFGSPHWSRDAVLRPDLARVDGRGD